MPVEMPSSTVAGLSFIGRGGGAVKTLTGFQKAHHTVPSAVNAATSAFLKEQKKVDKVLDNYGPYVTAQFAKTALAKN